MVAAKECRSLYSGRRRTVCDRAEEREIHALRFPRCRHRILVAVGIRASNHGSEGHKDRQRVRRTCSLSGAEAQDLCYRRGEDTDLVSEWTNLRR